MDTNIYDAPKVIIDLNKQDAAEKKRKLRNKQRRERDQTLRDLGLKKVRGALGGTYWE